MYLWLLLFVTLITHATDIQTDRQTNIIKIAFRTTRATDTAVTAASGLQVAVNKYRTTN